MTHPVDELQQQAHAAIARMQEAAREARQLHARAELMRHMRLTATTMNARPLEAAVAAVGSEWMHAWSLDAAAYPGLAREIAAFIRAFCIDAREPTTQSRAAIVTALGALDAAFTATGTTLADQMAFRSECAHGWWSLVVPRPEPLRDAAGRRDIPKHHTDAPFWSAGAKAKCG